MGGVLDHRALAAEADRMAGRGVGIGSRSPEAQRVLEDALRARHRRELADLDVRRCIRQLADAGYRQRDIADTIGVSQPEVSRRLKRQDVECLDVTPREIIMRRATGELSGDAMIAAILALSFTAHAPHGDAAHDGGVTLTGTVTQIANAYQERLISRPEYERLRTELAARAQRPTA